MTKLDWVRLNKWFSRHDSWAFGVLITGFLAITFGSLLIFGQLVDANVCEYHCPPGVREGEAQGPIWDGWTFTGLALYASWFIAILSLPANNLILKIRRRDFFTGEQRPSKREIKLKEREREAREAIAAVRQRERELELPPYEFGRIGN